MAYSIYFSGLMVFVRYKAYEQVDVLLLNPCAEHHAHGAPAPGAGATGGTPEHGGPHPPHDEATCLDHHFPQLMVKASDIAEWNLPGAMHGCGWHHFDLTGKTVFPNVAGDRTIARPAPPLDEIDVDPFGTMRHVQFNKGIISMAEVLKDLAAALRGTNTELPNPGRIDHAKVSGQLGTMGKHLIAARVRLPKGELTALAPLDTSPRRAFSWTIGAQTLEVLAEAVMFVPDDRTKNDIELDGGSVVTVRNKPNVGVWISAEPIRMTRAVGREIREARHFDHYFQLLPPRPATPGNAKLHPLTPLLAPNLGNPLCPPTEEETDPPLP
jgi:hypothetical protein